MPIVITQIVKYSIRFTRYRVSQTASLTRSMPRTKMRAPTTQTAGENSFSSRMAIRLRYPLTQEANHGRSDEHDDSRGSRQHDARQPTSAADAVEKHLKNDSVQTNVDARLNTYRIDVTQVRRNRANATTSNVGNAVRNELAIQVHIVFLQRDT